MEPTEDRPDNEAQPTTHTLTDNTLQWSRPRTRPEDRWQHTESGPLAATEPTEDRPEDVVLLAVQVRRDPGRNRHRPDPPRRRAGRLGTA
jgi:hypothetical protein